MTLRLPIARGRISVRGLRRWGCGESPVVGDPGDGSWGSWGSRPRHLECDPRSQARAPQVRAGQRRGGRRSEVDYEYEARRRLYARFEPALFQLLELADYALER